MLYDLIEFNDNSISIDSLSISCGNKNQSKYFDNHHSSEIHRCLSIDLAKKNNIDRFETID